MVALSTLGALLSWAIMAQGSDSLRWEVSARLSASHNSMRPAGENDGPLWQGRGANGLLQLQVRYRDAVWAGGLGLALWGAENRGFPLSPFRGADAGGRSPYAYPLREATIDWPQRWGEGPVVSYSWEGTFVRRRLGAWAIGAGAPARWIGPGRLNALFWSTHAPAYWHLWAETDRHVRLFRSLHLGGLLWTGLLRESPFFDAVPHNDRRLISGLLLEAQASGQAMRAQIGIVSVVYRGATWKGAAAALVRPVVLPFQARWRPWAGLYGGYVRVALPGDGAELYAEWARGEPAHSLRDWLTYPLSGAAWTIGLEKRWLPSRGRSLRLQAELTRLEAPKTELARPQKAFYTDSVVTQGYTHLGQGLGAWIGPGSNSQWLRLSLLGPVPRELSLWVLRHALDNDRFYRIHAPDPNPTHFQKHETELRLGLEAAHGFGPLWASFRLWHAVLYNRYYRLREEVPNLHVGFALMYRWRR
ncbi:MAG: hypothetical protein RMK61_01595 [Bacteroidota bacterium]|nr:hypothetical protein [Rhodothermia bacterium]MDW8137128.1 hypothetical protein [Bacteroidota bacterium]